MSESTKQKIVFELSFHAAKRQRQRGVSNTDLEPVSYTHLRAHETVLDLVCRLLLEKKNQEQTRHNESTQHHQPKNTQTSTRR